jgi:hypothetical protein
VQGCFFYISFDEGIAAKKRSFIFNIYVQVAADVPFGFEVTKLKASSPLIFPSGDAKSLFNDWPY